MAASTPGPAGACHVSRLSPSSLSRVDRSQILVARRLGSHSDGGSEKTLQVTFTEKQALTYTHLMPKYPEAAARRIRRDGFGCAHLSLYFLRLKFKLGSRGTGVGYKNIHSQSPQQNQLQNSSVRTPTGAGLHLRHQLQNSSARTPTGAGLHL